MKLVVGLGNPGKRYAGTRHNVGFDILDRLADRHKVEWESAPRGIEALIARQRVDGVVLAKPLTFMNASGPAVVGLLQFFKIDVPDLLVIVDDVNLELARLRARAAGSAGGHNGLKSIIGSLGTNEFIRLRIGIQPEHPINDAKRFVLDGFTGQEKKSLEEILERAAQAVRSVLRDGIAKAMSLFNG